jgi:hypothetical protein
MLPGRPLSLRAHGDSGRGRAIGKILICGRSNCQRPDLLAGESQGARARSCALRVLGIDFCGFFINKVIRLAARKLERSRRRDLLHFKHHAEVLGFPLKHHQGVLAQRQARTGNACPGLAACAIARAGWRDAKGRCQPAPRDDPRDWLAGCSSSAGEQEFI